MKRVVSWKNKHPVLMELYKTGSVVIGGLLVAFGLEAFLIPNDFLDGGITGISILLSKIFNIPMGIFLALLNIPFIIMAWKNMGRRSAIRTTVGISALAFSTTLMHHMEPLTDEFFVALLVGGSLLGLGIGIALRNGGALDGTETLAAIISKKRDFPVNTLILIINIVIFSAAAFIVGIESAIASAVMFFFAVSPMINRVVNGDNAVRHARVLTNNPVDVARVISSNIDGRRITSDRRLAFNGDNDFEKEVYDLGFVVSRIEESDLTDAILKVDSDAIVLFSDVSSLHGGTYDELQKSHH